MSQEQLADRLGVSRQSVSKWELGEAAPDIGNLVAIGELFGVSLDALLKDELPLTAQTEAQPPDSARRGGRGTAIGIGYGVALFLSLLILTVLGTVTGVLGKVFGGILTGVLSFLTLGLLIHLLLAIRKS